MYASRVPDNIQTALTRLGYKKKGFSFVFNSEKDRFSQEITLSCGMYIVRSCENGIPHYWVYRDEKTFVSEIIES